MSDNITLTDAERLALRHGFGLNRPKANAVSYRNYYNATDDSIEYHVWLGLVARGLARMWKSDFAPGSTYFAGSEAAFEAVREPGEEIDQDTLATFRHEDFKTCL